MQKGQYKRRLKDPCTFLAHPAHSFILKLTMDDDNEVLDWDEDDEQQVQVESFRKASLADAQDSGWGGGDADDDDAVSLGPDDDEHEYLPQDSAAENGSAAAAPHDSNGAVEGAKHSSNSKTVSTPKSATFPPQQPVQRENSSNSLRNDHSSAAPSPRRPQSSSTPAKLIPAIHGLPAKPIVASVPFFPPSHPSLIEATAMSNPTGKKNGIVNSTSSGKSQSYTDDSSLPPHWEVRQPRSSNSGIYYYNIKTQESTWSRPVSSLSSPVKEQHLLRHFRGSNSGDRDFREPPSHSPSRISQTSNHQSSQHHPSSRSAQAPHDGGDPPPIHFSSTSVSVSGSLSYDDRHYRPGENAPPVEASSHGKRPGNTDSWFGGESPPPVSPHSRERERSLSPPPSRQRGRDSARHSRSSQRPGRGARGANNDRDDISMNRGSVSPPRNWIPAAHVLQAESANANQGSRRQPRQQNRDDDFVPAESYVERPKLQSRQSNNGKASRGQNRDREQLRERDQQQQHNQNISTSSTLIRLIIITILFPILHLVHVRFVCARAISAIPRMPSCLAKTMFLSRSSCDAYPHTLCSWSPSLSHSPLSSARHKDAHHGLPLFLPFPSFLFDFLKPCITPHVVSLASSCITTLFFIFLPPFFNPYRTQDTPAALARTGLRAAAKGADATSRRTAA